MKRGFLTLIVTLVAGTLFAPGKAQAFPIFDLAEIWAPIGTPVTSVNSFVPGTSIPITVTTTQPIARTVGGQLNWASGSAGFRNDWVITIGEPSADVEITLRDFDRFTMPGGLALETLSQLEATLGEPTSLITTGAEGDAQMSYQPGVDGGRIRHSTTYPNNVDAGTAVALWEDVNLSTITFTTTRNNNNLSQNINVRLGEVEQVVPEPSTWLLLGMGLTGLAYWRKRAA